MPTNAYTRLPGRRLNSLLGTTSLWLGGDHILKVTTAGYSEEYRRFYLADVRGFVMQRTNSMAAWIGVLGVLSVGLGLAGIGLWSGGGTDDRIGGGIMGGAAVVFLVLFLTNLIRGPSCNFYIKTAIQTDRIPSISRIKSAEALIAILTPLILEAQKSATGESDTAPGQGTGPTYATGGAGASVGRVPSPGVAGNDQIPPAPGP